MIFSWLTSRIHRLYAVDGREGDIAPHVLEVEQSIYDRAWNLLKLPSEYTPAAGHAALANAISEALKEFTGFSSVHGRIARMEMMHVVEGLKTLVALGGPEHFANLAGPSIVPVTAPKAETDVAKASGNNADPVTSTRTLQNAEGVDYGKITAEPTGVPSVNHARIQQLAADWRAAKAGSSIEK